MIQLKTVFAALVLSGLIGQAAPACAQSVSLPPLIFPTVHSGWGCSFYNTCTGVLTKNNKD